MILQQTTSVSRTRTRTQNAVARSTLQQWTLDALPSCSQAPPHALALLYAAPPQAAASRSRRTPSSCDVSIRLRATLSGD